MNQAEALKVVKQVCYNYKGTKEEHVILESAIRSIEDGLRGIVGDKVEPKEKKVTNTSNTSKPDIKKVTTDTDKANNQEEVK